MVIREFELFHGMSNEMTEDLVAIMQHETHPSGTVLFHKGDPAEYFYILSEGRLELTLPGRRQIKRVVAENPGDLVGWSSLVDRKEYSTTVTCARETKLTKMVRQDLDAVMRKHPADGRLFYKRLTEVVGERLVMCHEALEEATRDLVA